MSMDIKEAKSIVKDLISNSVGIQAYQIEALQILIDHREPLKGLDRGELRKAITESSKTCSLLKDSMEQMGYIGYFSALHIANDLADKFGKVKVDSRKIIDGIREIIIQIYYEEMYPVPEPATAEDLFDRKQKAIDKYLGRNLESLELPILRHTVDKAMAFIIKAIEEGS